MSSTASLTQLNKDPTPDTKEKLKTTATQGVASLTLSGQGASSSSSANLLAVTSSSSGTATNNRDKLKNPQGRRLLEQAALPTCQAVADLVSTVQGVGGLLAQTTDPATGPTSAGSSGLYVTAASLVGRSFDSQVLAVGTAMAPSSSGSAQDSLVASTAAASTNVRVSFSKPMVGTCTNTDDAGAAVTSQCVGAVVPVQLHLYESPEALLCSSPPASSASRRLAGTSVTAADVALLSDAATLSVAGGSTLPCESGDGDCSATLSFPLYATVTPNDPGVQCFKVEGGSLLQPAAADGWQLGAIAAAQDDPATQVAQCVVGAGGTYTIGRLRSVPEPSASPPPSPPLAPPPPSPVQQGVQEAAAPAAAPAPKPEGKVSVVTVAVTFPMSFESLVADAAQLRSFKDGVVSSVAAAANVSKSWVNVTDVRKGSVVADVAITVPAKDYSSQKLADLGAAITANPDRVFTSVKAAFGITQPITAVVKSIQEPRSQLPAVTLGVAIGVSVGGVAVVAAGAALWYTIRKRKAQRVFPGGAQGADVGNA
jgi:hypothetical protein